MRAVLGASPLCCCVASSPAVFRRSTSPHFSPSCRALIQQQEMHPAVAPYYYSCSRAQGVPLRVGIRFRPGGWPTLLWLVAPPCCCGGILEFVAKMGIGHHEQGTWMCLIRNDLALPYDSLDFSREIGFVAALRTYKLCKNIMHFKSVVIRATRKRCAKRFSLS